MRRKRGGMRSARREAHSLPDHAQRWPAGDRQGVARAQDPAGPAYLRRGLTVAAFLALQRAGSLVEGPRAELIGGVVSAAPRLGPAEAAVVVRLAAALQAVVEDLANGGGASGPPAQLERSAAFRLGPHDLLRAELAVARLVAGSGGLGGSLDPRGALLIVELSRGRLSREVRAPLFAAAGAKELWLLDVDRGWTEVLRSPWRGLYRSRTLWYPGEAVPSAQLGVEVEALPPA